MEELTEMEPEGAMAGVVFSYSVEGFDQIYQRLMPLDFSYLQNLELPDITFDNRNNF